MTANATLPPRGWYSDPYGSGGLRYWDGTKWAPNTAPPPLPPYFSQPATAGMAGWWPGTAGPAYGAWLASPAPLPAATGRPPLDLTMDRLRTVDQHAWGLRPAALPSVALVVLAVLGGVVTSLFSPGSHTEAIAAAVILNLAIYAVLAVVVWYSGRDVAARCGGWGAAFGLRRPTGRDVGYAAAGVGIAFGARIAVATVADLLSNGRAAAQAQNLQVQAVSVAGAVLLVAITVLAAPVIEEIIFRGLLLRTLMRRVSFWPAALISTFIFALFHTYEVSTLVGAVTLMAVVATLGLINCVLVRLTDRLTPGMLVHGVLNGVATLFVLLQVTG